MTLNFASQVLVIIFLGSTGCQKRGAGTETSPFRIIATDAGFEAPNEVPAGMRHLIFENHGKAIHEAMLVKLPAGMSADDYVGAVKGGSLFPEGGLDYSGPGLTSPGQSTELWVKVDPGNYLLICWNGKHARTTGHHPFTVSYTVNNDPVPKEDAVLRLVDFKFELEGRLERGEQVIRIETPGPSMHEADIFRLHPGKTVADLQRWRNENQLGPAPADAMGGILDSHDLERVVWLRKNFTPGRYAFHCEMPLTTDASTASSEKSHSDLGMVREFEIRD
ncbi:MAG: hypothetical protein ABI540_05400 [Spartobacteria bacterium]